MKKVIVGIGIPGSGKTTALKAFAERNDYAYISPDEVRKAFTGSESDQTRNQEVWKEAYRKLAVRLAEGKTVVFDATFTNPDERKNFLAFAKTSGAEKIQGVLADTPAEIAKERNENRQRKVPAEAIDRMSDQLKSSPPEILDGFDSIFTIDEYQNLAKAERTQEGEIQRRSFR